LVTVPTLRPSATKDEVIAVLVSALSPYIGAAMASASARGLCERLALGDGLLSRAEVARLIDALAPGLHVFAGKERTRVVIDQIWSAIDALGGHS
jgi:hypothetical protein